MRLLVVAVGVRMPQWVAAGFDEYRERMPREARIELIEVKPEKRSAGMTAQRALERESERIQAALPETCLRIVLDERGRSFASTEFSRELARWRASGRDLAFLIGGADGLSAAIKASAQATLSLSAMTLPHGLARVVLAEQLYRAHTILSGHPYHRA
jgi:23S rRNA (pseudouridine1915-N3)-methyltransferase